MEPLSTIFLFIAILALFAALALGLTKDDLLDLADMGPESILNHAKTSAGTLTLDVECNSGQALAQIAELTAAIERMDEAQRKAGLNLRVLDVPPVRLPAPAPQPKRRRKPRPEPKRETKPDTREVERKGR